MWEDFRVKLLLNHNVRNHWAGLVSLKRSPFRCLVLKMFFPRRDHLGGDCRADPLEGLKYISQLAWECLVTPKEQLQRISE